MGQVRVLKSFELAEDGRGRRAYVAWLERRTIRKKFVHKTDKARPPAIAPAPLPSICPRYRSRHAS